MTLHLYFARRFAVIFAGLSTVFFLLMALIDLVEQVRRFSADTSFTEVLGLTLLNAPQGIYNVLPLVMILSTVALFLGLARSSELVVARAVGRSGLRTLMAPVAVSLLIGILGVAVFNPLVAATSKRYEKLYARYESGGADVLSLSGEGLWLRQGDTEGQTVIRAERSNADGTRLEKVTFMTYATEGGPLRRIEGSRATLVKGAWEIDDAKIWTFEDGVNPEAAAEKLPKVQVASSLTEDRIRDSFGAPSTISIWDLPAYIAQLETAGFSARRHIVWFYMELARPLFLTAMVLISSAFTMRHARFGRTGIAVLAAVLLGFTLYYIRNFSQILGENGQIPVLLAAWTPPIASILLALGLLLHMEDG